MLTLFWGLMFLSVCVQLLGDVQPHIAIPHPDAVPASLRFGSSGLRHHSDPNSQQRSC